jgi:type IV secretory pathway TraG/TraD family ATPase VirD4
MLPQEPMQMPQEQLLVLGDSIPVIKVTKIFYFTSRDFLSRSARRRRLIARHP